MALGDKQEGTECESFLPISFVVRGLRRVEDLRKCADGVVSMDVSLVGFTADAKDLAAGTASPRCR